MVAGVDDWLPFHYLCAMVELKTNDRLYLLVNSRISWGWRSAAGLHCSWNNVWQVCNVVPIQDCLVFWQAFFLRSMTITLLSHIALDVVI